MKNEKNIRPLIFTYDHYLKYINDLVLHLKKTHRAFSFRFFAKEAGFASPSTLKFVLDGKRQLTHSSIQKFCKGLKLNKEESEFFENLVLFNQSQSLEEKNIYFLNMCKNRKYRKIKSINKSQYDYFSNWYFPAIRELIAFKDFEENSKWINQKLQFLVDEKEIKKTIKKLLNLGLIERTSDGKLIQKDIAISSGAEVQSLLVKNFHQQMSKLAIQSMDEVSSEKRDISGMTLGIPLSKVKELKQMIDKFRNELQSTLGSLESNVEEIYHLNIQLFPITKTEKK